MNKKIISTKVKVLMVILLISSIACFTSAGIVLYKSGFSLANYFNWDSCKFGLLFDDYYGYNNQITSNIPLDSIETISINLSNYDNIIATSTDNTLSIISHYNNSINFDVKDYFIYTVENNMLNITFKEPISTANEPYFEIYIPQTYSKNISITSDNSNISLNNIALNSLICNLNYGDISLNDGNINSMNISLNNGDIYTTNITTTDCVLNTTNGDISLSKFKGENLNLSSTNGEIDCSLVTTPSNIDIKTEHGDVDLCLPQNSSFELIYETTYGDLENDFYNLTETNIKTNSNGKTYILKNGSAENKVTVKTSNGELTLYSL